LPDRAVAILAEELVHAKTGNEPGIVIVIREIARRRANVLSNIDFSILFIP